MAFDQRRMYEAMSNAYAPAPTTPPAEEVVETPFGKFLVDSRDVIDATLEAGTLWDGPGFLQPLAVEYGRLGERGVTILDVGAHHGAFSVWLARQGAWRVVAVEPVPQTMQRLKANLDLNREATASCVIPIEVAAYDARRLLWVPPVEAGNTGGVALRPEGEVGAPTVAARPLDEYRWLCPQVSLIKVDAQGCDGRALRGAQALIEVHHPAIVFEWEADLAAAHGDSLTGPAGIWEWLVARGYHVHAWPSQPNNYV